MHTQIPFKSNYKSKQIYIKKTMTKLYLLYFNLHEVLDHFFNSWVCNPEFLDELTNIILFILIAIKELINYYFLLKNEQQNDKPSEEQDVEKQQVKQSPGDDHVDDDDNDKDGKDRNKDNNNNNNNDNNDDHDDDDDDDHDSETRERKRKKGKGRATEEDVKNWLLEEENMKLAYAADNDEENQQEQKIKKAQLELDESVAKRMQEEINRQHKEQLELIQQQQNEAYEIQKAQYLYDVERQQQFIKHQKEIEKQITGNDSPTSLSSYSVISSEINDNDDLLSANKKLDIVEMEKFLRARKLEHDKYIASLQQQESTDSVQQETQQDLNILIKTEDKVEEIENVSTEEKEKKDSQDKKRKFKEESESPQPNNKSTKNKN